MKIDFVVKEEPRLENPLVICGLPGSALVGKVAADHLIETLDSRLFVEIYCDGLPPQIFIEEDGTPSMMRNEIYYSKRVGDSRRDLVIYTGDAQPTIPEVEYELSDKVISFLQTKYNATELVTFGAYSTGEFAQEPKVYAAMTAKELGARLADAKCSLMPGGLITGMNGLLLGLGKIKGMSGYALLGETSGYAIDPKASEALLIALARLYGIRVDLRELKARAKEAQSILGEVEAARRAEEGSGGSNERKPGYIT